MPRTLISLGANLGNVVETMGYAQNMLREAFGASNVAFSQLYRTPAIGGPAGQDDFLNGIVALESDFDVWHIWEVIKKLESQLGRHRMHRWEARRIDIDVLLHEAECIWTPHFKVPHPRMCMRSFILLPALEVAPDWLDPVSRWSLQRLLENAQSDKPMVIACTGSPSETELQLELRSRSDFAGALWITVTDPTHLEEALEGMDFRLLIVVVASPDPENVLWEDFAHRWASALGMVSNDSPTTSPRLSIEGPRYLLPANNLPWAAHEILSARSAMDCRVEPIS